MLNEELFLPADYRIRADVAYFDDTLGPRNDIVHQPEIYPLAERLLIGTQRTRLVDVGCGIGRKLAAANAPAKLGIDFGANLAHARASYPDAADWWEVDLGQPVPQRLADEIAPSDVVICSDVVEHIPDPRPLLAFLAACFRRGAVVITSTPDRALVRGPDDRGPPPNPSHVREWTGAEYRALLATSGLPPLYLGLTHNNDKDRLLRTIVSIHEPRLQHRHHVATQRPLAILSCFNEADILDEVIEHWIAEGCDLQILDNWSTDASWPLIQAAAARFGRHVTAERFPSVRPERASWHDILASKSQIASGHKGRWILHTDADEIRRSPFPPFNLADAMQMVGSAGWNRIQFTVLNHRPVDASRHLPGSLATTLPYFEFGTKPGHFIQQKAWIQGEHPVDLTTSGGHVAAFEGARDCPYHFVLHHYPLRSIDHARRKIHQERHRRWSEQELARGWHSHYAEFASDTDFVWDPAVLHHAGDDFWARHGLPILSGLRR